jgi:CBS domain containing-hemolysin-like protein
MGIESILLVILFLLMEGLFTGSEIAVISTDRSFLKDEAAKGKRYARLALDKLEKPERVFATSLTGTDMAVVANTILFTTFFISRYGKYGEIISVLVLVPIVSIFGEILPKSIFQAHARKLVPFAIYFLHFFSFIFAPVVALVSSLSEFFLKVFKVDVPAKLGVTREELIHIATKYKRAEDVAELEQKMVRRVFEYSEKKVKDVMVPLIEVIGFREDRTIREAMKVASIRGYSRYPVFSGRIDNVTGFINVLDAFTVESIDMPVSSIMRKALFVPESAPIDELLELLKKESMPLGIVVDEHGGVTGIITIEDILEEVVGEIEDEFDKSKFYSRKESEGTYVVSGKAPISVVENLLRVDFTRGDFTTISGYIMDKCGCIPRPGEIIEDEGIEIKVIGTSEKTIDLVRIRRIDDGDSEGD